MMKNAFGTPDPRVGTLPSATGFAPALEGLRLVDYKVRILTPNDGTKAVTRVMIESTDGHGNRWTTVGVSANVIDASYNALHDSITYRLFRASGTRTPDASADNR